LGFQPDHSDTVGEGLRHHREDHAARLGQRLRRQAKQHHVVGAGQGLVEAEVHLVLATSVLVVDLEHVHPGVRQRVVQCIQEVTLPGQRAEVVRGLVEAVVRVGRHPAPAVGLQQEELGLDAGAQVPATLGEPRDGALEHLPRAAIEGLIVDEAVADHARNPRHPGQCGHCAGIAAGDVVAARAGAR
jgi:hypothetical protein